MNTSTRQLRVLTLGATLAGLALFIGTLTFAAIPGTNGVIHACYDSKQGDVRVVDEAAPCEKDETALSWNQTGPQGPVGAQGPTGATGLQGPIGLQGPAGPAPSKQWMSRWNWTRTLIGVQFSRAETEVFIANPAPVGGGSPSAHVQLDFFVSQT